MEQSGDDATDAAACNIVMPPQSLVMQAAISSKGNANKLASIARAERALEHLSEEFDQWMAENTRALLDARDIVAQSGPTHAALDALLVAALDIKGLSTMLGYPFAGLTCASLCNLIENSPDKARIPLVLIDYHVDAVKAELRENADKAKEETARAIVDRLHYVTKEFLDSELARVKPAASAPPARPANADVSPD